MSRKSLSTFLLTAAVLAVVSALVTLVPYSSGMISDLGYYTLCPFAPWSTLLLLVAAGAAWVVRRYVDALAR